jgi:hypothetical protein
MISCSGNPDKIFEESINKYKSGNKNSKIDIEASLIKSTSDDSFDFQETEISASVLFNRNGNRVKIVYPEKFKLNIRDAANYDNFQIDVNKTHAVLVLDGIIHLYKRNGDFVKDIAAPDKEGNLKIEAAILFDENIIYYSGGQIYIYSYLENKNDLLISEKLNPQLKGLNRIILKHAGGKLFITAGIGGAYNINIADIEKKSLIIKNLSVSSSRIFVTGTLIKYIDGGSGQWKLLEMSLSDKKIKELSLLTDIVDIELFENCAVIEGKKNISIFDYNKFSEILPFDFELGGSSAGKLILINKDKYYTVSADKLLDKIKYLKENAPDLFVK